tara:strand:+ start:820 stop:1083 length:264 start_codon:yes stop_codon:yes gene_type:complete
LLNEPNIFGKSFYFQSGDLVRWNSLRERKELCGVLVEMLKKDTGGRMVLYGKVLFLGETQPKSVLAIKLRLMSDKKLINKRTKGILT